MVDCGATSHIITEKDKFTRFDESFDLKKHYMELVDGSGANNLSLKCGNTYLHLQDFKERRFTVTLKEALFIPTCPQDIFSVRATTADGAKVIFKKGQNELTTKAGTVFRIEEYEREVYCLKTVNNHNVKKKLRL